MGTNQPSPSAPQASYILPPMSGVPPSSPQATGTLVKWRIVIDRNGKHYLYLLELQECLSGYDVMCRIVRLYRSEALSMATRTWHLFHTVVADTAELEWIPDTEAQHQPPRVALARHSPHQGLAEACGDPRVLSSVTEFARRHPDFVMVAAVGAGDGTNMEPTKAVFIHPVLKSTSVAVLMSTLVVFLLVGLGVGLKLGRVDVAIGVTGVVACTLASFKPFGSLRK